MSGRRHIRVYELVYNDDGGQPDRHRVRDECLVWDDLGEPMAIRIGATVISLGIGAPGQPKFIVEEER